MSKAERPQQSEAEEAAKGEAAEPPEGEAAEPAEMFDRAREEGRRRLSRSWLEVAATAFVAGFDVVFGIIALGAADAAVTPHFGAAAGHLIGALAFGIAFVFITVGQSELFTENFLVPVAGLDGGWEARRALLRLWLISPVVNIVGGTILVLIVSTHGVLPTGADHAVAHAARHINGYSTSTAFLSAIAGGALITLMTWLIEGSKTPGSRIVAAWIAGALLALCAFDHVIVVTLEMIFGMRVGADIGALDVLGNFGVAVLGNMIGGLLFVTLTRTTQAFASGKVENSDSSQD